MDRRLPITFILITVVLDSMGIGLIIPVMPDLIQEVEGADLAAAAVWGGILSTIFAAMQFLFGPTIGSISDRFGRRSVLLISLLVMVFDYLLMAVAGTMAVLIFARIIGGITAATQSTAAAFMADISEPEEKAANFGLLGAAFGVGFILGPLLGGVMADYGTRAPFYAAAALAAANLIFGYFVLPETVTDAIRRPFDWRRANPLGALRHLNQIAGISRLLLISFIDRIAFFVYPGVWSYFVIAQFNWGPRMIGFSLAIFGIGIALAQGVLMRPILSRIGERNAVVLGFSANVLAYFLLAFMTNGIIALCLTPLAAIGSIADPALKGIMSQRATDNQQGELQGVLTSIVAVATVIAPLAVTQTFWYFTKDDAPVYFPGAPFLLSGALTLLCIMLFVTRRRAAMSESDA